MQGNRSMTFCSKCGSKNYTTSTFCSGCGNKIKDSIDINSEEEFDSYFENCYYNITLYEEENEE